MKTTFKLCGISETDIITNVNLSSKGIDSETEMILKFHHLGDFKSKFDALLFLNENESETTTFEHGFTIIETVNFE